MRKFLHNERKNINTAILNTARKKKFTSCFGGKGLICLLHFRLSF